MPLAWRFSHQPHRSSNSTPLNVASPVLHPHGPLLLKSLPCVSYFDVFSALSLLLSSASTPSSCFSRFLRSRTNSSRALSFLLLLPGFSFLLFSVTLGQAVPHRAHKSPPSLISSLPKTRLCRGVLPALLLPSFLYAFNSSATVSALSCRLLPRRRRHHHRLDGSLFGRAHTFA
ncbi:hypothetical protein V8C37DRAFT_345441 [Trichoderma ceciliae]